MPKSLVIDTNVLVHSATGEGDYWACRMVVDMLMTKKICMSLDDENIILIEYIGVLKRNIRHALAKNILDILIEKYKRENTLCIKVYKPINRKKVKYLEDNKFHKKDIIFIKIAPKTDLKIIISSDNRSFLNKKFSKWIEDNLAVNVKDPQSFIDEINLF